MKSVKSRYSRSLYTTPLHRGVYRLPAFRFSLMFCWLWTLGCAPVFAQPDWMTRPPGASSLYMYGVGIAHAEGDQAADRQRADDAARADIARQLRVTINASLTSTTSENTDIGIAYDTRQVVESSVSITLDGVEINKRHYDKKNKTYYALARLNRQRAADRFGQEVQSAAQRAGSLLDQAHRYQADGAAFRAFLTLLQAADERATVEVEESMYRVLASGSVDGLLAAEGLGGSDFKPDNTDIERLLNGMTANMVFEKTAGDGQIINRGRLAMPLSARLTTQWADRAVPAAGFPVVFDVVRGYGKLESHATVGAEGMVQSVAHRILPGGAPFGEVAVAVDTAAIRAQAPEGKATRWLKRLGEVQTRYTMKPGEFGLEDGLGELAYRLSRRLPENHTMVVGRFTYQNTRIAAPFTGPVRRILKKELAEIRPGRLIEQTDRAAGAAEAFARSARADAVIWGEYWERGDSLLIEARMTTGDGARLASAQVFMPRNAVGYDIRPPAVDPSLPDAPANGIPIQIWTDRDNGGLYVEGERLKVFAQAESDCYLRLLYRQADGTVIQIFPNSLSGDERVSAGQVYAVPGADAAYDFIVQPPFGVEYLVAIAGSTPFTALTGREINGGILLHGSMAEVINRLTRDKDWYGQAVYRMTTVER